MQSLFDNNKNFSVIAGPCSVEGRDMLIETAQRVKAAGAVALRGGAYKPRTSPRAFQGLGIDGLKLLAEARRETGLPIVTEVTDVRLVETVAEYADMLQVGARNMQNFALLSELGKSKLPVLLKRGPSPGNAYMTPINKCVRGLRGAITVDRDDALSICSATREMLIDLLEHNKITKDNVISAIFLQLQQTSAVNFQHVQRVS